MRVPRRRSKNIEGKWFSAYELIPVAPDWPSPVRMVTQPASTQSISAPSELGLETRASFREAAIALLDGLSDGGVLNVDLAATKRVDSAGLSALMLIQRRAADRGQRVVLSHPSDEFRFLLALTQLTDLFEVGR